MLWIFWKLSMRSKINLCDLFVHYGRKRKLVQLFSAVSTSVFSESHDYIVNHKITMYLTVENTGDMKMKKFESLPGVFTVEICYLDEESCLFLRREEFCALFAHVSRSMLNTGP